jgi:uncharacterized protein YqhQ
MSPCSSLWLVLPAVALELLLLLDLDIAVLRMVDRKLLLYLMGSVSYMVAPSPKSQVPPSSSTGAVD